MKFICEKNILQEAISNVQKAITGKSTMSILLGILIVAKNGEVTLIGSDTDLSIEAKIKAEVVEEGSVVLDSKLFGEIIRKLPNSTIEITSAENNAIKIVCEKSNATIIHMNSDDYPKLPSIIENMVFSISQKVLKNMMRGTTFAVAQDETRPILTGVLFEIKDRKLNLVSLDGYRVAFRSESVDSDYSINAVIPGKTLSEVSKILEETDEFVNITFTPNHILFNLGKTKVVSRLLEGEFIKYNSIIPEEYNLKITAKRSELLNCIERASLMAKEGNTNLVKFNIEEDTMVITSNSQLGKSREELNIILQGEPLQIAFNSKYLIELLKIMEEEEIIMEFSSGVNPCVVKNKEKDNCTYMVLPVRIRATNN
ncbi:DNA polymerase III subunit beta [Clostridium sp. CS001]|uniref:DNA polymerase III subunit beta n=1 Tax=Clostridium sp. CS001 TaxID=2880648 RepID=UPI001CF42A43|nr:DNA polymerase III subunit beta [Clostridium sp. CS001]MCB2290626.1 DNA polymerase III subunit beta [Clostridium sp. CS001]